MSFDKSIMKDIYELIKQEAYTIQHAFEFNDTYQILKSRINLHKLKVSFYHSISGFEWRYEDQVKINVIISNIEALLQIASSILSFNLCSQNIKNN